MNLAGLLERIEARMTTGEDADWLESYLENGATTIHKLRATIGKLQAEANVYTLDELFETIREWVITDDWLCDRGVE